MSPRPRVRVDKSKKRVLEFEEELALVIGGMHDHFETPAHAARCWFDHRDEILANYRSAGDRPEREPPSPEARAARLAQLGELSDSERAEIRARSDTRTQKAVQAALAGEWTDPDKGRCSSGSCKGRVTGQRTVDGRIQDVCSIGGHTPVSEDIKTYWWYKSAGLRDDE